MTHSMALSRTPSQLSHPALPNDEMFSDMLQGVLEAHNRKVAVLKARYERELAELRGEVTQLKSSPSLGEPSSTTKFALGESSERPMSPKGSMDGALPQQRLSQKSVTLVKGGKDDIVKPDQNEEETEKLDANEKGSSSRFSLQLRKKKKKTVIQKLTQNKQEPKRPSSKLEKFIDGPFDHAVCTVILLNTIFLVVQLQYHGRRTGFVAGLVECCDLDRPTSVALHTVEHIFNVFFVIEIILRLCVQRFKFFYTPQNGVEGLNIFDVIVVLGTSVDLYVQTHDSAGGIMNFNIFRPLRFLRLIRTLRVLQSMRFFLKLRILLSTIAFSFMALFWSIMLLFATLLMAALFMNQAIAFALDDEQISFERRAWLFQMYGTSARAFYTVFELTFSGGWPNYARPLVEEISPWWAVFFIVYIIVVVFAMFRIITALFLRDTLALAANDADTAVEEKMQWKNDVATKLLEFFNAADTSGDGLMSIEEFQAMLEEPKVCTWLSLLELDVSDAMAVFSLFKDSSNMVGAKDFVAGVMRVKGAARSQDVLAVLQNERMLIKQVDRLRTDIRNIETSIKSLKKINI